MSLYEQFYRQNGVLRRGDLRAPKTRGVADLELPRSSMIHFIGYDDLVQGPEPVHPLLENYEGRVAVEHISELQETLGGPMANRGKRPEQLIKDYHQRYRKLRRIRDLERSLNNERTLVVENYALLNSVYRYRRSIYGDFYRWHNIVKTLFQRLQSTMTVAGQRQHFIPLQLPETLVAPQWLQRAMENPEEWDKATTEKFTDPSRLMILAIWQRLGSEPKDHFYIPLSMQQLRQVNIVVFESGRYAVMNLGRVVEIFFQEEVETDGGTKGNIAQRAFLRLLVYMIGLRSPDPSDGEDPDKNSEENPDAVDDETVEEDAFDTDQLTAEIESIEQMQQQRQQIIETAEDQDVPDDPEEALQYHLQEQASRGRLSPAQKRRYEKMIQQSKDIKNPFGDGELENFREIKQEDLDIDEDLAQMPEIDGVIDKSMQHSSINAFDRQYIEKIMDKDIANSIMHLQKSGIIVRDVKIEDHESVGNHYRTFSIKVQPIGGEASTLKFNVPVVNNDGTFESGGSKYRMRKQRNDVPIRKVSPSRVALSSYYAKLFIERSAKKVVNYADWVQKQVINIGFDDDDERITQLRHVTTFDHQQKLPRIYTILAQRIRSMTVQGTHEIYVDYAHRKETYGEELVDKVESENFTFAGMSNGSPIVVGEDNVFYRLSSETPERLGTIEELVGLDNASAPVEIAELKLFKRLVPLGIAMGYLFGLDRLMQMLEVEPRRVNAGQPVNLQEDEYAVRFRDETLVFPREKTIASLILAGLNRYHQTVRRYPADSFNRRDVYANILEENGFRVGFMREMTLTQEMFVDPITHDILEQMNEPTTILGLFVRSCELLQTDYHPEETSMEAMRDQGYERISGTVYGELVRAVRLYRSRGIGQSARVEMNPEAVWQKIQGDSSKVQVEDSNPIKQLKEKEAVTFRGNGGRQTQSMVKRTRKFHESDKGVTSEATVDSGEVGVNVFLSADPRFANLRGLARPYDENETGPASLISTSAMAAPAAQYDDPKRINFISIQNGHLTATEGARATPLQTGYERMMAHRVDDNYAVAARGEGRIESRKEDVVVIAYEDGSKDHIEIGRRYGRDSSLVIPHHLTCDLGVGDTVSKDDVVVFHTGFFERDPLSPRQVIMKTGVLAKVAIVDNAYTYEDASAISESLAKRLGTQSTEIRTIWAHFDQQVHELVEKGSDIEADSILCTIEDPASAQTQPLDDETLSVLQLMNTNTPRAKKGGTVEHIEVLYRGDIDQMSESLQKIAQAADEQRKKKAKRQNRKPITGKIEGRYRIEGEELERNTVAIRVYITAPLSAGIGDKGTFGNQMKSVFSQVLTGTQETESGTPIDAYFGYQSISNRIVLSPEVWGTTNTLLQKMSEQIAKTYFDDQES